MSDAPQPAPEQAPVKVPLEPAAAPLPNTGPENPHIKSPSSGLMGSIQSLCVTIAIAVFVITFLVQAFQIPSESMEDTLLIGDYLLVDKVHFANGGVWEKVLPYRGIQRGEIIVFRYPVHPAQHFVKRVVGVPGDHIRLVNKQVFVNGKPVAEKYAVYHAAAHDPYRDDFPSPEHATGSVEARWWLQMRSLVREGELIVPPGKYFVLGDNRDESLDSRYWGFVPRENIIGRPLLIYWSLRRPAAADGIAANDTLSRFTYVVTHLFSFTRWDRTFRIVR